MIEYEVWTAQRFTAATPVAAAQRMRNWLTDNAAQSEYIVYWVDGDTKHKFITDGDINDGQWEHDGAGI